MQVRSMISFTPIPILFEIGPVAVRYYGLAYAIGFLLTYFALRRSTLREHADDLTLWIMIGVIAGGRIGEFIFYTPQTLLEHPLELFMIWHGGMSFHGGLLGCILAVWLYCRSRKISFLQVADIVMVPAAIAIVLGRIANFLNGELTGTLTTVPWCVVTQGIPGCRHPSPLYEALYTLIIVGALVWLHYRARTVRSQPQGTLLAAFLILYGLFRFIANFWREDIRYAGISTGQYLSLATLLAGIALYLWLQSRDRGIATTADAALTDSHKKSRKRRGSNAR